MAAGRNVLSRLTTKMTPGRLRGRHRSADMALLVRIDRSRWSLARELLSIAARTEGGDPVVVAHYMTWRLPGRCVGMPMTGPGRPRAQPSVGMCPSCESNVYWS